MSKHSPDLFCRSAARASASGLAQISAVGVFKRLRAAEPWVRWLAQQMRGAAELPMAVAEALEFAAYFMVWTTLSAAFPAAAILDLYRLRWQIELAFKRMKSILGLGHLPKKDPLSAKAWLEGKLFTGLLIERMVRSAETFSPWGYALAVPPQSVA